MRVSFFIDGFNLYHSIRDVEKVIKSKVRWLDLTSLLSSYLEHLSIDAKLQDIYFFTAIRNHVAKTNPESVQRHQTYIKALESSGIRIIKGKFKRGQNFCKACNKVYEKYEEKETDVHIAIKIIEMAMTNRLDAIVIVSGDTDLIPAVDLVRKYFPDIRLYVIFPYNRKNSAILSRISGSFKLKAESYKRHQLPERIQNQSNLIVKPKSWC